MFKLYCSQFGTNLIPVEGNIPQPVSKWPVGGEQPKVNAGGNTYPLDMVAALTEDGKALTIAIVNPTESDQKVTIQLDGEKTAGKIKRWTISGTSVSARNIVEKKPEVQSEERTIDNEGNLTIGASTINIYRYEFLK